jgi:hypothetical protein
MENHSASPIYCEHANESPAACPCPADCYCRVHGNCGARARRLANPRKRLAPEKVAEMQKRLGSIADEVEAAASAMAEWPRADARALDAPYEQLANLTGTLCRILAAVSTASSHLG